MCIRDSIPGVGKTLLVKALAKAVQGTFSRVQCTPDLLPSDILGFSMYDNKTGKFDFHPGSVFCNLFLSGDYKVTGRKDIVR